MRKIVFTLLALLPLTSMAAGSFVVKDMRVEGLQRISEGTVFNYLPVNIGDTVDSVRIGEAIRALYGQGLFDLASLACGPADDPAGLQARDRHVCPSLQVIPASESVSNTS